MSKKNKSNKKAKSEMNTKKDLVSVITTFYNARTFILNAVSSVMQQIHDEYFDIEYIIVDDKSPDDSRELIDAFLASSASRMASAMATAMPSSPPRVVPLA